MTLSLPCRLVLFPSFRCPPTLLPLVWAHPLSRCLSSILFSTFQPLSSPSFFPLLVAPSHSNTSTTIRSLTTPHLLYLAPYLLSTLSACSCDVHERLSLLRTRPNLTDQLHISLAAIACPTTPLVRNPLHSGPHTLKPTLQHNSTFHLRQAPKRCPSRTSHDKSPRKEPGPHVLDAIRINSESRRERAVPWCCTPPTSRTLSSPRHLFVHSHSSFLRSGPLYKYPVFAHLIMPTFHSCPRRRPADTSKPSQFTLPQHPQPWAPPLNATSLRKGATFHSPKSPSSPDEDPILDIKGVPQRSPTCPDTLARLVTGAHEQKALSFLESFDRHRSGQSSEFVSETESLPVPRFFFDDGKPDSFDRANDYPFVPSKAAAANKKLATTSRVHQHTSDSGLGSSVSSGSYVGKAIKRNHMREYSSRKFCPLHVVNHLKAPPCSGNGSVYSSVSGQDSAINKSHSSRGDFLNVNMLSEFGHLKIKQYITGPILNEIRLKEYHSLVRDVPSRIDRKSITCLRDLEKTLIFLAPVSTDFAQGESVLTKCFLLAKSKARSAASYLNFCEFSIQCIHTTVDQLSETDLRRPTDRPYTNNYFLDLVQQVREYARIMAASRQKQAEGQELDEMDYSPSVSIGNYDSYASHGLTRHRGEKLRLKGGISQNGKPSELVREKNGKSIPVNAGTTMRSPPEDLIDDDAVERVMARKRKCDIGKIEWRACRECGKQFTRNCDLTKHEKTHSRPWKCSDGSCKYHEYGWPTEKERDRHYNDKHAGTPALYKCLFEPCTYTSKRESNCKQHMEKAHNWDYKRSKSKKGQQSLQPTYQAGQTSPSPGLPTPQSALPSISSPESPMIESPLNTNSDQLFSPASSSNLTGSPLFQNSNGSNTSLAQDTTTSGLDGQNDQFNLDFSQFADPGPSDPRAAVRDSGNGYNSSLFAGTDDFASIDSTLPTSAWEGEFNFGNMTGPQPSDFFTQYNGHQQPTPAMSDFNFSAEPQAVAGAPSMFGYNMTPDGSGDQMLVDSHDSMPSATSTLPHQSFSGGQDFTLFGEIGAPGGEPSTLTQMFPDLNTVGNQLQDRDSAMSLGTDFDDTGDFNYVHS